MNVWINLLCAWLGGFLIGSMLGYFLYTKVIKGRDNE